MQPTFEWKPAPEAADQEQLAAFVGAVHDFLGGLVEQGSDYLPEDLVALATEAWPPVSE
jgi:hypothetical protein